MTTAIGSSTRPLIRLVVYYLLLGAAVTLIRSMWPEVFEMLARGASVGAASFGDTPAEATGPLTEPNPTFATALVIIGAFVVMLPVAWVYMITKHREGYDRSVVQTLIVLPTAICGVVVIVQNSLMLAFALAGIVAAVRFRNTLKDTKDAVYIFLAIGVGLASGVQNLDVALIMSLLFNITILGLWFTSFGNIYATHVGDHESLSSSSPKNPDFLAEGAQRLQELMNSADSSGKGKRPNAVLRIQLADPESARPKVEAILDSDTKIWSFMNAVEADGGDTILQYLIRAKKSVPSSALVDRLDGECAPHVTEVEIRPLSGSV